MNDESIPDVPDAIAKTRSIVQRLASQQVKLRAAKLGDVVGDGADTIRDIGAELQKRRESPATQSLVDSLAKATDDVANRRTVARNPRSRRRSRHSRDSPRRAS